MIDPEQDFDWGTGWLPVRGARSFQCELDREIDREHPLYGTRPSVFGRRLACDDVVASVSNDDGEGELVVIHLTWSVRFKAPTTDGSIWPYFEKMTAESFVARFLRGGEHL